MSQTRSYTIQINGLEQSIAQVDALNQKLDALEQRMDKLSSGGITINANVKSSSSGDLAEQSRLEKEIATTLEKAATARSDEYQNLLKAKAELKEYQEVAKSIHAQENLLTSQNDLSTMRGMKAELKDIKQAMQTMDVDSGGFKILSDRAGEITQKLKELEAGYGTFSRNVGNYQSAFDAPAFEKLQITVNGVVREFDSAREALRSLTNERNKLKLMGQDVGDLDSVVKKLKSDIQDMEKSSASMDMLLDSIQGVMAIASTAKGISSLFGFDNDAIEETIKKLVALQNVMQGIELIRKQQQTGEGIGGLISRGSAAIDKMVASLTGVGKAAKTSSKALQETAVATTAVGTASKAATVAATALGVALKALGIGLIIAGVTALITAIEKWIDKQKEAKRQAEELREEQAKFAGIYAEASAKMQIWQDRIDKFNGTRKQEKQLVEQLNKEYGTAMGRYKTLAEWKKILTDRGQAYINVLILEAKAQAQLNKYVAASEAYDKARNSKIEDNQTWLEKMFGWETKAIQRRTKDMQTAQKGMADSYGELTDLYNQIDKINQQYNINDYAPTVDAKTSKAEFDSLKRLNELKIQLMKEGLAKIIAQLDEERRQRIAEAKKTGQEVAKQIEDINQLYNQKILDAKKKFNDDMITEEQRFWKGSRSLDKENFERRKASMEAEYQREIELLQKRNNESLVDTNATMYNTQRLERVDISSSMLANYKKYIDLKRQDYMLGSNDADTYLQNLMKTLSEAEKTEMQSLVDEKAQGLILNHIKDVYAVRIKETETMYEQLKALREKYTVDENDEITKQYQDERNEIINANTKFLNDAEEWYRKRKEAAEINGEDLVQVDAEYEKIIQDQAKVYQDALITLERTASDKRKAAEKARIDETLEMNRQMYAAMLEEEKNFSSAIDRKLSTNTTHAYTGGLFNFIRPAQIRRARIEAVEEYEILVQSIMETRDKLSQSFKMGEIDYTTFQQSLKEIDTELEIAFGKIEEQTTKLKTGTDFSELTQQISQYAQMIGNTLNDLLSSVWEYQDYLYERSMDKLQEQIDRYQDLLQQQEAVTKEHADNVKSIEDELANSRGDRRQELIDQLNAQMQAQRASLTEEKRIAKEREKMEEKAEKMEHEQAVKEHKRAVIQATISAALAVANALATNPFIPMGIIASALAASLGAAQVALIAKQKPYAKGGQLEGLSHKEGGIPVGNTGIFVEGKEYVIRKESTQPNVGLLDYINNSKKKLTLDDFIDYYGKPSKVKQNIGGLKFANGGQLPNIQAPSVSTSDRLLAAFEQYATRPTVVSVVEINDKQSKVNQVEVLAGKEV